MIWDDGDKTCGWILLATFVAGIVWGRMVRRRRPAKDSFYVFMTTLPFALIAVPGALYWGLQYDCWHSWRHEDLHVMRDIAHGTVLYVRHGPESDVYHVRENFGFGPVQNDYTRTKFRLAPVSKMINRLWTTTIAGSLLATLTAVVAFLIPWRKSNEVPARGFGVVEIKRDEGK